MAEQPPERPGPRDAMIRTAASEAVSLLMLGAVVWYFGPGRLWVQLQRARVAARWNARGRAIDLEVAEFARDVSRTEHDRLGR
jgi:hypothetical protein